MAAELQQKKGMDMIGVLKVIGIVIGGAITIFVYLIIMMLLTIISAFFALKIFFRMVYKFSKGPEWLEEIRQEIYKLFRRRQSEQDDEINHQVQKRKNKAFERRDMQRDKLF